MGLTADSMECRYAGYTDVFLRESWQGIRVLEMRTELYQCLETAATSSSFGLCGSTSWMSCACMYLRKLATCTTTPASVSRSPSAIPLEQS